MMAADSATLLPPEPANRLDRRAVSIWRLNNLLSGLVLVFFIIIAAWIMIRVADPIANSLIVSGALLLLASIVLLAWFQPEFAWRYWRFEVREEEIDLKHGWLTATRTLVPISRVQHIDTRRSPVERHFRAATLVIHTAAGTVEIPALPEEQAASIATRITALANIHDDL
jgi:membrane protein YdbS with pleckstrin-like domain